MNEFDAIHVGPFDEMMEQAVVDCRPFAGEDIPVLVARSWHGGAAARATFRGGAHRIQLLSSWLSCAMLLLVLITPTGWTQAPTPPVGRSDAAGSGSIAHLAGTWRGTITAGEDRLDVELRLRAAAGRVEGDFDILAATDRGVEKGRRRIARPTWSGGKLTFLVPVGETVGDGDDVYFELRFRDGRLIGTAREMEERSKRMPVAFSKTKRIWLCEVIERNTDTFPRPLDRRQPEAERVPFRVLDHAIVLQHDIASETDATRLEHWNLKLARPDTPLDRCRALVVYTTRYTGTGREAVHREYHAFPDLPCEMEIPESPSLDRSRWVFDPARDPVTFLAAVARIRAVGLPARSIQLKKLPNNELDVRLGQRTERLKEGATASLARAGQAIRVLEKAVPSAAVKFINAPRAQLPRNFLPARSHGDITFTTEVLVRFHGVFSAAVAGVEKEIR